VGEPPPVQACRHSTGGVRFDGRLCARSRAHLPVDGCPHSRAVAVVHSSFILTSSPAAKRACFGAAYTRAVEAAIPATDGRSGAGGELERWALRQTGPESGVGPTAAVEVPGTRL